MSAARSHPAFAQTDHRPWPLPDQPWSWEQAWCDLLFIHFEVDPAAVAALLPPGLHPDLHGGKAWIGLVPFRMEGVTRRGWPAPAWLCDFAEINVRTYVTHRGKPGVWFLSLDVINPLVAAFARTFFHLPYWRARIGLDATPEGLRYRVQRGAHRFEAVYAGGEPVPAAPGSFAEWATERYCLYTVDGGGRILRAEVQHPRWSLQKAQLVLQTNTMSPVALGAQHPEVYFARRVDVVVWPLVAVD